MDSDELIKKLRSWKRIRFKERTELMREAADIIEELEAEIETLQADAALSDVCCLDYKARIKAIEAENKVLGCNSEILSSCNKKALESDETSA